MCDCCRGKCSKQTNLVEEAGLQRGWTKAPVRLESRLQGSSCQWPLVSQSGQAGQTPHGGRLRNCTSFILELGSFWSDSVPRRCRDAGLATAPEPAEVPLHCGCCRGQDGWLRMTCVHVCVCFGVGLKTFSWHQRLKICPLNRIILNTPAKFRFL